MKSEQKPFEEFGRKVWVYLVAIAGLVGFAILSTRYPWINNTLASMANVVLVIIGIAVGIMLAVAVIAVLWAGIAPLIRWVRHRKGD